MFILLHGNDTYRSRQKLRELTEKFLREVDPSGANLTVLDGRSVSATDVWGAIAAQSFLVRKRMVVVERINEAPAAVHADMVGLLEKIPEDVVLVCWEGGGLVAPTRRRPKKSVASAKKKSRANGAANVAFPAQLIAAADHVQEFAPLEGPVLDLWIRSEAERRGATIDGDAVRALVEAVGPDLWRMANEIEKLTMAAMAGQSAITSALVRAHIDVAPHDDIFAFVDALGRGDVAMVLRELAQLESADADPHYLLAMAHRQIRLLVQASEHMEHGMLPGQLASALAVHPFVAQKLTAQARRVPSVAWRMLLVRLLDLDRSLKSSRAPARALLERFCLEVSAVR